MTTFETNPVLLTSLLSDVETGRIQLPEFQRGWVWDDYRIRAILASISRGFPVGAIMMLRSGGDVRFKGRLVEGVGGQATSELEQFLLDGQQRLTSLYQALKYSDPVKTRDGRKHWYYVDMMKALDDAADREEAIVSVPENKRVTRDFGRETILDLSTPELEYANHMMPTERLMDWADWIDDYREYWGRQGTPSRQSQDIHEGIQRVHNRRLCRVSDSGHQARQRNSQRSRLHRLRESQPRRRCPLRVRTRDGVFRC